MIAVRFYFLGVFATAIAAASPSSAETKDDGVNKKTVPPKGSLCGALIPPDGGMKMFCVFPDGSEWSCNESLTLCKKTRAFERGKRKRPELKPMGPATAPQSPPKKKLPGQNFRKPIAPSGKVN